MRVRPTRLSQWQVMRQICDACWHASSRLSGSSTPMLVPRFRTGIPSHYTLVASWDDLELSSLNVTDALWDEVIQEWAADVFVT